jgi:hypothetical protein
MTWYERRPLPSDIVASAGVVDEFGNVMASESTDTADAQGFGGATNDRINYGIWNGAFQFGPSDPNAPIDADANPLPYWTGPFVRGGGAITVYWVVDPDSPSGYNLRFEFGPGGAAADDVYLEQVVDISGDRPASVGHKLSFSGFLSSGASSFSLYTISQYLDAAGTSVGTADTWNSAMTSTVGATFAPVNSDLLAPSDARYLRIHFGAKRGAVSPFATGAVDAVRVRLITGDSYGVLLPDSDTTSTHGRITRTGGRVWSQNDSGEKWLAAGYIGVQVTRTATLSLTTAVAAFVDWDSEVEDPDGFHSNATNPSRLTIPAGMGGRYVVWCRAGFAVNAAGDRTVSFWKNTATTDNMMRVRAAANTATIVTFSSFPIDMAAGDYFRLEVTQDSGGALNLQATSLFGCYRIS